MILYIDTTKREEIEILLAEGRRIVARKKIFARRQQAEKLLPTLDKLLAEKKIKPGAVTKIKVAAGGGPPTRFARLAFAPAKRASEARRGLGEAGPPKLGEAGSFTSLRIGVVTANALAYAWGVPLEASAGGRLKTKRGIKAVAPCYSREPDITVKSSGAVD